MRNDQELLKCQRIVDSSIKGYLILIERKDLLDESIKAGKHLSKTVQKNLLPSIRTIQDTLYTSLIIDIHAWLFDSATNSSNLSTYKLLDKLKRDDFKLRLKAYFTKPPETISVDAPSDKFWHHEYIDNKSHIFDTEINKCLDTYEGFINSDLGIRIKSLRDGLLAHKDGQYSMIDNGHKIGEAIEAVNLMRIILVSLNTLIQKCSYPLEEIERSSSNRAKVFWLSLTST